MLRCSRQMELVNHWQADHKPPMYRVLTADSLS